MINRLLFSIIGLVWLVLPALAAEAPPAMGVGPYTALLRTTSGGFTAQPYMNVHGLAIAEGDIVLGQHADIQKETLRNLRELARGLDATAAGVDPKTLDTMLPMNLPATGLGTIHPFSLGLSKLWPNKTVPFDVDPAISPTQTASVLQAAKIWNALGIVTFKRVTSPQPAADVLHVLSAGADTSGVCATTPARPQRRRTPPTYRPTALSFRSYMNSVTCSDYGTSKAARIATLTWPSTRARSKIAISRTSILSPEISTAPLMIRARSCSMATSFPGEWTTTGHDELWFTLAAKGKTAFAACVKTLPRRPECQVVGQRCAISSADKAGVAAMYK